MRRSGVLHVLGAGGHGRVVADVAECMGYTDVRFLDLLWPEQTQNLHWPVVGRDPLLLPKETEVFVALGGNRVRFNNVENLMRRGFILPILLHPSAIISNYARIEAGTVVMAHSTVNAGARLGVGSIVNTGASIDHDCTVGDCVHISPGVHLAGSVEIGNRSWIGIGAVVREGVKIGSDAMIGAGAVVITNVPDGARFLGLPAKESN